MSMNREQHLDKIIAKLDSLIAGAKLRTPGRWEAFQRNEEIGTSYCRITFTDRNSDSLHGYCGESNATFIASCAGNAEAGWVSMRDKIASLKKIFNSGPGEISWDIVEYAKNRTNSIIAAWPEEML